MRFRVFTWQSTWEMIRKPVFVSPLQSQILGTGLGTFKIVYPLYRKPQIFHIEGKHNTETDHPENEFLEIWYDEGIIGIAIFLWLLFTIYYISIHKISYVSKIVAVGNKKNFSKQEQEKIALQHYLVGFICGLCGMLVHNLMCVNMRFVSSGYMFWVVLGLTVATVRAFYNPKQERGLIKSNVYFRSAGFVVLILTLFLMFHFKKFFLADLHHNKGIAYSKAKVWEPAIKEYRETVKYNPSYIMTYYFLGNLFNDRWDMNKKYNIKWGDQNNVVRTDAERALSMYDKVKSLAPNYVQVHYQVGTVYMKLGEFDKAIQNFEKYLKLDPIFSNTYLQLGWIYSKQKQWDKSEKMYKKAIELKPSLTNAYLNLGNMYYFKGDKDSAEKAYLEAVKRDEKNKFVYQNLVIIYGEKKEFGKALEIAK
ncbi:tetratricopeptide repeat protein, partial [bacterium]